MLHLLSLAIGLTLQFGSAALAIEEPKPGFKEKLKAQLIKSRKRVAITNTLKYRYIKSGPFHMFEFSKAFRYEMVFHFVQERVCGDKFPTLHLDTTTPKTQTHYIMFSCDEKVPEFWTRGVASVWPETSLEVCLTKKGKLRDVCEKIRDMKIN